MYVGMHACKNRRSNIRAALAAQGLTWRGASGKEIQSTGTGAGKGARW